VQLGEGATVAQLRERLSAEFPQLESIVTRAMIAVDTEYARNDQQIRATNEIALIPPVSGG
jgi:molybdopterin converting factor small subunit